MKLIFIYIIIISYIFYSIRILANDKIEDTKVQTNDYTIIQYFGIHNTSYNSSVAYKDIQDVPVNVLYDSYEINAGSELLRKTKYLNFGGGFGISTQKLIDSGSPLDMLLNQVSNDKSIFPTFNFYFVLSKDFKIKQHTFFAKTRLGIVSSFQATRYKQNDFTISSDIVGGGNVYPGGDICVGINGIQPCKPNQPPIITIPPVNLPSFPNSDIPTTIKTEETIKIKGKAYISFITGYVLNNFEFGIYYNINKFNLELQQLNFIETAYVDVPFLSTLKGDAISHEIGLQIAYRINYQVIK